MGEGSALVLGEDFGVDPPSLFTSSVEPQLRMTAFCTAPVDARIRERIALSLLLRRLPEFLMKAPLSCMAVTCKESVDWSVALEIEVFIGCNTCQVL